MAIANLKLLEIKFPSEQYDSVLAKLVKLDDFHPEYASKFADSVHGLSVLNRENPYADLIARMDEAKEKYQLTYNQVAVDSLKMNVIQADTLFCDILAEVTNLEKIREELNIMLDENKATVSQLEYMMNSGVDFDKIFSTQYLKVRFGRIPTENLDKLQYYGAQEFMFKIFHKGPKETYCMYMATNTKVPVIDNIFSSLYFERIRIPEFVHGTPEDALKVIQEEDETARHYVEKLGRRIQETFENKIDELSRIYTIATRLNETYDAQKYVVVFGDNASVYGFSEEKVAEKIKADFETIQDVLVEIKPATGDSRLTPPTKLSGNWFSRPFSMFVEMYGVPSYTEFDPTTFVAISYTFLFGMMFGDVGQGLVLSLVGYLAYKLKGMQLGAVGIRLGFSSAIFGLLFGSIFGSEEVFHALLFVPMEPENVMTLLMSAIGIGVGLIIIAIIFNIYLNAKNKHIGEMLFSQNGVAGLVFYVSVLLMVVNMFLGLPFVGSTIYTILFIALPVLVMFLKEPLELKLEGEEMFPEGFGGFFTTAFFEMFEVMLTFIANTMSFLRVGGFVLSHAGMMLVVYTLAEMVGGAGYWVVLVFGNIFVMCLEGMIVGIQVLRLEFYEMFSRYYSGKGKPFVSIKDR